MSIIPRVGRMSDTKSRVTVSRARRKPAGRGVRVILCPVHRRPERAGPENDLLGGPVHDVAERAPEEYVRWRCGYTGLRGKLSVSRRTS